MLMRPLRGKTEVKYEVFELCMFAKWQKLFSIWSINYWIQIWSGRETYQFRYFILGDNDVVALSLED
jgi:hypothetical protein